MKVIRSIRKLNKMHIYVHRRFHDADTKFMPVWLAIRTRIIAEMLCIDKSSQRRN